MYSPKIREVHISILYKLARVKNLRMTQLVDQVLVQYLASVDQDAVEKEFTFKEKGHKR